MRDRRRPIPQLGRATNITENLNDPAALAALQGDVDAAIATLQPKSYEDAVALVNSGMRERFLSRLRHPGHSEGLVGSVGTQINEKFDRFVAAHRNY